MGESVIVLQLRAHTFAFRSYCDFEQFVDSLEVFRTVVRGKEEGKAHVFMTDVAIETCIPRGGCEHEASQN
jgi:hypothetical protein